LGAQQATHTPYIAPTATKTPVAQKYPIIRTGANIAGIIALAGAIGFAIWAVVKIRK